MKIRLADSSRCAALQTLKGCLELKNESDSKPLELICPPLGVFDSYRLMSQGTVLTQIDFLARAITTLNATLDLPARELNGRESIGMKHGLHFKKKPNADGRYGLPDEDGILPADFKPPNMYKTATGVGVPVMSDLECERVLIIPPGQKRTVCVAPLCGVCNSAPLLPLLRVHAPSECRGRLRGGDHRLHRPRDGVHERHQSLAGLLPVSYPHLTLPTKA